MTRTAGTEGVVIGGFDPSWNLLGRVPEGGKGERAGGWLFFVRNWALPYSLLARRLLRHLEYKDVGWSAGPGGHGDA